MSQLEITDEDIILNKILPFPQEKGFFIKTFLVDSTVNSNNWAVTQEALENNIASFIGKPIILTPEFGHPEAEDGDALLLEQDKFKVGTIIDIGIETVTGKGWAIAEITKGFVRDLLLQTGVNFVSPSIVFGSEDIVVNDGIETVIKFEGAHLAIVKDPAYGIQKAQIKGQCAGSPDICLKQLRKVQAVIERSKCGGYLKIKTANVQRIVKASNCVENCLRNKSESGIELDDQAIAICFSECGENRNAECVVDQKGNCVIDSSLEDKKSPIKTMTANEDEIKKQEEEKARKAELHEEEEKARKAQEEEEEKKAQEEKEKEEAQDEEKEKKVDDIAKLKAEIDEVKKELKDSVRRDAAKPIVDKIVSAKVKLNLIKESESQKEFDSLIDLPTEQLNTIASQYNQIGTTERKYSVLTLGASTEHSDGDELLIRLGSVD